MRILQGHTAPILCLAYSADCRYLASGSADETVRLWDLTTGECERVLPLGRGVVLSLAFGRGDRALAIGLHLSVMLWDLDSGARWEYGRDRGGSCTVAFSSGGEILALCGYLDSHI